MFLVFFAPFAFGATHPWAYGVVECVAFGLLFVVMAKLLVADTGQEGVALPPRKIWLPLFAFVGLVVLQLLPLPPGMLRVLSPSTYTFYEHALPGWPQAAPFAEAMSQFLEDEDAGASRSDAPRARVIVELPSPEQLGDVPLSLPPAWNSVGEAPPLDRSQLADVERWVQRDHQSSRSAWRSLSLTPTATSVALLQALACIAVFLVVAFHRPTGSHWADYRFERRLLRALVCAAVLVALVGLLQRFLWNGKILWFFVPLDWGVARPEIAQTSGPFVSRNSFAGYLGLLLPLALVPALIPSLLDLGAGRRATVRWFGAAAVSIIVALLWSLSRGGWLASLAGVGVLIGLLARRVDRTALPLLLYQPRTWLAVASMLAVAASALLLVPVEGRGPGNDIDLRLEETLRSSASWDGRLDMWRDTIPMIRDFPVLGVGLGAWDHAFPRYDTTYFDSVRARHTHNDYLQVLSETGIVGLALLGCALGWGVQLLVHGLRVSSPRMRPIAAAAAGGASALFLHEIVDFNLQIPAIAVTFSVLFALGCRGGSEPVRITHRGQTRLGIAGSALAVTLLALTLTQPVHLGPERQRDSVLLALEEASAFPGSRHPKLDLAAKVFEVSPEAARRVLESAVAVDPQAPGPRDALAATLGVLGDPAAALAEIEESVARAPGKGAHAYLIGDAANRLTQAEREAVERGFRLALPEAGAPAAAALAAFLQGQQELKGAAEAWRQAAELAPVRKIRASYLRRAGIDLARSGDLNNARREFERAIALAPTWPAGYVALMGYVQGPESDIETAKRTAARARAAGADAYEIDLGLAEAARQAQQVELQREVLERAQMLRPSDSRAPYRLGLAHYRARNWALAAASLERALDNDPKLAGAWYYLGASEERQYHFEKARRAFEIAASEDPRYRPNLERFTERLAKSGG